MPLWSIVHHPRQLVWKRDRFWIVRYGGRKASKPRRYSSRTGNCSLDYHMPFACFLAEGWYLVEQCICVHESYYTVIDHCLRTSSTRRCFARKWCDPYRKFWCSYIVLTAPKRRCELFEQLGICSVPLYWVYAAFLRKSIYWYFISWLLRLVCSGT